MAWGGGGDVLVLDALPRAPLGARDEASRRENSLPVRERCLLLE